MADAFTDAVVQSMLDQLDTLVTHLSLHSGFPGAAGANELSGGSPAYARKAVTYAAASGRSKALSGNLVFDVPAATVAWLGKWTALTGGTFRGFAPLGGSGYLEFQVDVAGDKIISEGHGLSDDDKIVFFGGTVPGGLTEGTTYFVVTGTSDDFQVAATQGGAAINLTSDGDADVVVSQIVEEVFASQGQYTLTGHTISID